MQTFYFEQRQDLVFKIKLPFSVWVAPCSLLTYFTAQLSPCFPFCSPLITALLQAQSSSPASWVHINSSLAFSMGCSERHFHTLIPYRSWWLSDANWNTLLFAVPVLLCLIQSLVRCSFKAIYKHEYIKISSLNHMLWLYRHLNAVLSIKTCQIIKYAHHKVKQASWQ